MDNRLSIILYIEKNRSQVFRTLDSLLEQGINDLEILVYSKNIITPKNKYADNERIKFFIEDNKYSSFNIGAKKSSGNILFFIDESYEVDGKSLFIGFNCIANTNADAVGFSKVVNYWNNWRVKNVIFYDNDGEYIPVDAALRGRENEAYVDSSCSLFSPFLIKKEIFNKINEYKVDVIDPQVDLARRFLASNFRAFVCPETTIKRFLYYYYLYPIVKDEKYILTLRKYIFGLIRTNYYLRNIVLNLRIILDNCIQLIAERSAYKQYFLNIKDIISKKEIVIYLEYGGIGDCLVYTSLPRLLMETYGVKFYLSESSRSVFRNQDILKLCFSLNPYFCGFKESEKPFQLNKFSREKGIVTFFTSRRGLNNVEILENQFKVKGVGRPEIFYKCKNLEEYRDIVLVDKHWVSGKKMGLYVDDKVYNDEVEKYKLLGLKIEFVNPLNQDLFSYIDKIYSCHHFISMFSGGNVISAALNRSATVILPENFGGSGMTGFIFKQTNITYVRNGSLALYIN